MPMNDVLSLSDETATLFSTWASMQEDRDRCQSKIERMRGELLFSQDAHTIGLLREALYALTLMLQQYEHQLGEFPKKRDELRLRYQKLQLTARDAICVDKRGLN